MNNNLIRSWRAKIGYIYAFFFVLILFISSPTNAQVYHDISQSSLVIPVNSQNNYIVSGSSLSNHVIVQPGYHGKIILRNLSIYLSASFSPIRIVGVNNCSNTTPVSVVDIVLDGDNVLEYSGNSGCAAFQVDQGTQVNISAIDPFNNYSGTLTARSTNVYAASGIGALVHKDTIEAYSMAEVTGGCVSPKQTAGGNVVISSGKVTARGGHGAGIGGGYKTYYDGMILIYGGIVDASCMKHAAGIGSGCPNGLGVQSCYTPNSAIVVLPPSQITATGASQVVNVPVPSLALGGANSILYIGDPNKPRIDVRTEDYAPNAVIYVDLSANKVLSRVLKCVVPTEKLNVNKLKFGATNKDGFYTFNGVLQDSTTFFTDANSVQPATYGRPYLPFKTTMTNGGNVVLKLLNVDLSLKAYPSDTLNLNYSKAEASQKAFRLKICYNDSVPMSDLNFTLAGGTASDFDRYVFFKADSVTPVSQPTTLQRGDVYFVSIPLQQHKSTGNYADVFVLNGKYKTVSTGDIRQVVKQVVIHKLEKTICQGDAFFFNNVYLSQPGLYTDTLVTSQGKDSLVMLQLHVSPSYHFDVSYTICSSDLPFQYKDTVFRAGTQSGTYLLKRKTTMGCDSITTIHLKINNAHFITVSRSVCSDELPYQFADTIFGKGSLTGEYVFRKKTVAGCDSIVLLNLKINPSYHLLVARTLCSSDLPFQFGDTVFSTTARSGLYVMRRKTIQGCDSIMELSLTVNKAYHRELSETICQGTGYLFDGKQYFNAGQYQANYVLPTGCDSTIVLHLFVNPSYYRQQSIYLANDEIYHINGKKYQTDGVYTDVMTTVGGCDSTVVTSVSLIDIPNTFSPNGDGVNDVFMPGHSVKIYNRNGLLLFSGVDGWDGTSHNEPLEKDTYFYEIALNGTDIRKRGFITLTR